MYTCWDCRMFYISLISWKNCMMDIGQNLQLVFLRNEKREQVRSTDTLPQNMFTDMGATSVTIGKGNGNPLQCSCLENPVDRGAWWATVYGVAKSDTAEATQQQRRHHPLSAHSGRCSEAHSSEKSKAQCVKITQSVTDLKI